MINIIIGKSIQNFNKNEYQNEKNMCYCLMITGRPIIFPLIAMLFLATLHCAGVPGRDSSGGASRLVSVTSGEPVVPRHANTIFIADFNDVTGRSGIARRLTLKVKDLITRDGRLAVLTEKDGADLVLIGDITAFQIQPIKYGGQGVAIRKRMRFVTSVKLIDLGRGRIIFQNREVQAFMEYSEILPPVMSEYQVIDSLIDTLAERLRAQTITGWYTEYMSSVEKGKQ